MITLAGGRRAPDRRAGSGAGGQGRMDRRVVGGQGCADRGVGGTGCRAGRAHRCVTGAGGAADGAVAAIVAQFTQAAVERRAAGAWRSPGQEEVDTRSRRAAWAPRQPPAVGAGRAGRQGCRPVPAPVRQLLAGLAAGAGRLRAAASAHGATAGQAAHHRVPPSRGEVSGVRVPDARGVRRGDDSRFAVRPAVDGADGVVDRRLPPEPAPAGATA